MALPDECKRQDVIRVDGYEPVAVLAVRVWMREVGRQNKPRGTGEIAPTRSWENTEDSYQQHMGISNTWGESLIKTCGLNICANQEPRERVLEWTCRDRDIEKFLSSSEEPGHVKRSYLIYEKENYTAREKGYLEYERKSWKSCTLTFLLPKWSIFWKKESIHIW